MNHTNKRDGGYRSGRRLAATAAVVAILGSSLPAVAEEESHKLTSMWMITQEDFDQRLEVPYSAEGQMLIDQRHAENEAGKVVSEESAKCLPIGAGTMMTAEFAIEILETPGRITILSEHSTLPRTIYLNRDKPTEGLPPMWNGYSVGKWEGDTLVVQTNNFNDRLFPFGFSGVVRASTTTMVERISLSEDGQTLIDEMTFYDDRYLTAPHTITKHYDRLPADAEYWEYVCEVEEYNP